MIRRLLLLNGLAVLGVVINHSTGWGFTAMFWWVHRYMPVDPPNFEQMGSLAYYALLLVQQLIMFSVPAFLFVSGYFMAFATKRRASTVSWVIVRSRIWYLFIPYLLWSLLFFVGDLAEGSVYSIPEYLELLITGRTSPAYYFVPLLIQLYLLSPLIVPLAKRWPIVTLLVAAAVQLGVRTFVYMDTLGVSLGAAEGLMGLTQSWFFPSHLLWFTAGVAVGFHLDAFKTVLARFKWGFLAVALILLPLGVVEWQWILQRSSEMWLPIRETLLDSVYAAAFILAFLSFGDLSLPYSGALGDLGSRSYGIYLVHSPVLAYGARAIYGLAPWLLAYQFLFVPLLVVLGLGIPLLFMAAVEWRQSPVRGSYRYIFG